MGVSESKGYLNFGVLILRILLFRLLLGPPIFANPHVECSGISQIIVDHALDAELSLTDPTCQGTSCLHGPLQLVKAI